MTEHQLPTPPSTPVSTQATPVEPAPRRSWRRRLPSGRKAVAAGAVVAGLAIGGAGFGAGYAVGDDGSADTTTSQTTGDWGDRGPGGQMGTPPDGGMGGRLGGPMGTPPGGTTDSQGGTTGQQPDFDGDGQPDTDSGSGSSSDSGSGSDSSAQQS